MSVSKKREAETQLTKENGEELCEYSNTSIETWNKASEDVLSERRILKPAPIDSNLSSSPPSSTSTSSSSIPIAVPTSFSSSSSLNPFAALAAASAASNPTSTFTSESKSFGFSSYKTNPFTSMGPPLSTITPQSTSTSQPSQTPPPPAPISQPSPTSPKPNPFSSLNPAPNPFMSYDTNRSLDYWNKVHKPITTHQPPASEPVKLFAPSTSPVPPLPLPLFGNTLKQSDSQTSKDTNKEKDNKDENENEEDDDECDGDGEDDQQADKNDKNEEDRDSPTPLSPTNNPIANGESEEMCLLQLRTKLFRFSSNGQRSEWIEIGIGPLRILQPFLKFSSNESEKEVARKYSRLVMRRENTIRGVGTKLLLNVLLSGSVTIGRQAEKAIRLACFCEPLNTSTTSSTSTTSTTTAEITIPTEESESTSASTTTATPQLVPTSYLFKTESIEDADKLLATLQEEISTAKVAQASTKSTNERSEPQQKSSEES